MLHRHPFSEDLLSRLILFAITRQPSLAAQSPGSPIVNRSMDNHNSIEYKEQEDAGSHSLNRFLGIEHSSLHCSILMELGLSMSVTHFSFIF